MLEHLEQCDAEGPAADEQSTESLEKMLQEAPCSSDTSQALVFVPWLSVVINLVASIVAVEARAWPWGDLVAGLPSEILFHAHRYQVWGIMGCLKGSSPVVVLQVGCRESRSFSSCCFRGPGLSLLFTRGQRVCASHDP